LLAASADRFEELRLKETVSVVWIFWPVGDDGVTWPRPWTKQQISQIVYGLAALSSANCYPSHRTMINTATHTTIGASCQYTSSLPEVWDLLVFTVC